MNTDESSAFFKRVLSIVTQKSRQEAIKTIQQLIDKATTDGTLIVSSTP